LRRIMNDDVPGTNYEVVGRVNDIPVVLEFDVAGGLAVIHSLSMA
jgi:hypothetical protein